MFWSRSIELAHHSYAAEFDRNNPATIEGVVTEVWFRNPHVRYYILVTSEDGEEVNRDTRGLSPVKLVRQGWTKDTIKVGDRITICDPDSFFRQVFDEGRMEEYIERSPRRQ